MEVIRRLRLESKQMADDIFISELYQSLYTMACDKNFPSKYHKKAFNHLTKSIKRLKQIYEGE